MNISFVLFFLCDQDVEVEKQSHFAIVNMKTATTAAVSVKRTGCVSFALESVWTMCSAPSWFNLLPTAAGPVAG